jgi:hypothetical protein
MNDTCDYSKFLARVKPNEGQLSCEYLASLNMYNYGHVIMI